MSKRFFPTGLGYIYYICNKTSTSENQMAYSDVLIKQSFSLAMTKD